MEGGKGVELRGGEEEVGSLGGGGGEQERGSGEEKKESEGRGERGKKGSPRGKEGTEEEAGRAKGANGMREEGKMGAGAGRAAGRRDLERDGGAWGEGGGGEKEQGTHSCSEPFWVPREAPCSRSFTAGSQCSESKAQSSCAVSRVPPERGADAGLGQAPAQLTPLGLRPGISWANLFVWFRWKRSTLCSLTKLCLTVRFSHAPGNPSSKGAPPISTHPAHTSQEEARPQTLPWGQRQGSPVLWPAAAL